jgi:hypothetical protein
LAQTQKLQRQSLTSSLQDAVELSLVQQLGVLSAHGFLRKMNVKSLVAQIALIIYISLFFDRRPNLTLYTRPLPVRKLIQVIKALAQLKVREFEQQ